MLGDADIVVAGGNENMSSQPFLDYQARDGWKLGPRRAIDGTLSLVTDPFGGYPMGVTAERVAERYNVSRREQDRFAAESQYRAAIAIKEGQFESRSSASTAPRTILSSSMSTRGRAPPQKALPGSGPCSSRTAR